MRSTFLSFVLVLLSAMPARAQYQFGVLAGPEYFYTRAMVNEDLELPDLLLETIEIPTVSGLGYHAGVWYRSDRYHLVNFRAGLSWSYRPFTVDIEEAELGEDGSIYYYTGTLRTRLNYMEMPLQAQYYFWRDAHAEMGLVFGRMMYGNRHAEGARRVVMPDGSTYVPVTPDVDDKNTDAYARFELAWTIGAGYDFKRGWLAGISYHRALTPIEYESGTFFKSWFDQIRLNLGYDFLHEKRRRVFRWQK